jgi:hypothetical protein
MMVRLADADEDARGRVLLSEADSPLELKPHNPAVLTWNPSDAHIAENTTLWYRFTVKSHGIKLIQVIRKGFVYASLLSRIPPWVLPLASVSGGMGLGLILVFLISPITIIWVHDHSPAAVATAIPKLPDGVKSALAQIFGVALPWLASRTRVRRRWNQRYVQRAGDVADAVAAEDAAVATAVEDPAKQQAADAAKERARKAREDADASLLSALKPLLRANYLRRDDTLDAWVGRRRLAAERGLRSIAALEARSLWVDIRLKVTRVDGKQDDVQHADPVELRRWFGGPRHVVVVTGPGGTGKSALAAQLVHRGLAEDLAQRLAAHQMIPVFLAADTKDLLADIRRALTELTNDSSDLEDDILKALLARSRILVMFDGLSEFTPATRDYLRGIFGTLQVNALVVSSRQRETFGAVPVVRVETGNLEGLRVFEFLQRYVEEREKRASASTAGARAATIDPPVWAKLTARLAVLLARIGAKQSVTPLLVSRFVENAVQRLEAGTSIDGLPETVLDTFLEYLWGVDVRSKDNTDPIVRGEAIRESRAIARAELGENYVPSFFAIDEAKRALTSACVPNPDQVIGWMLAAGLLEQQIAMGTPLIRFAFDPVAEYLAALDVIERNGATQEAWDEWQQALERADRSRTTGFELALRECVSVCRPRIRVPQLWVLDEVPRRKEVTL